MLDEIATYFLCPTNAKTIITIAFIMALAYFFVDVVPYIKPLFKGSKKFQRFADFVIDKEVDKLLMVLYFFGASVVIGLTVWANFILNM